MNILSAKIEHIPAILGLLREFAEFEKLERYFEVDEERLAAALFGVGRVAEALIGIDGDEPAGYAVYYPNFATFRGQRGFYLEDLYVRTKFRGRGLGGKLLGEIARIGRARGYDRIDFNVLDWNEAAIGFYKRLGAVHDPEDLHFKFTDKAFLELVNK